MLICLWKGCEFATEEKAVFQEHVFTKHALQQQQEPQQHQLNLDKPNDVGTEESMPEMAKLNLNEDKMIKKEGQRKIIFLAVEVWVDVLGFVKRIQLAHSVCLANWKIYDICWPRLHGNRVMAHEIGPISISCRHELGQPPTALLLKESRGISFLLFKKIIGVPFPECPPPDYITGFGAIHITFLDHQVFAFLSLIAPRITANKITINFTMKMSNLNENQLVSVNRLLQICRERITTICSINFYWNLSSIQFLPDVDNKVKRIDGYLIEESNVPVLIQFLASPRADGQQRVMKMHLYEPAAQKLLDAIKKEFRTSSQPLPQPFFIKFRAYVNIPQSEEENPQTGETLTITPTRNSWYFVSRHPRGQHDQWAEDARKRLIDDAPINSTTSINMEISEFGVPFALDSS